MEKIYLNINEAASMLGVTKLTLRNWDNAGKLKAFRHPINNYRVYLKSDIDQIIDKIESGERPIKYSKRKSNVEPEKPTSYKLKVIHMRD